MKWSRRDGAGYRDRQSGLSQEHHREVWYKLNSDDDRPIEVVLRSLPPKVTMMRARQNIPGYQNWVDVPVTAAPDAPLVTERSVFAYGLFLDGKGEGLNSDMFTVTVQASP